MKDKRPYLVRVGDLASQALNTILLGGTPDESTSGRSYREGVLGGHKGWSQMRKIVDWLFSVYEEDHCKKAYHADLERARARISRSELAE
ncbi:hypothetical protein [Oceanospirillum maris]|uniref:hypothetical protein n=1 Tax=Oceanospirillum maris TaxID=64977 RepID=UPI000423583B|nr:hypothetical protein [Oceanospirillum maris]